MAAWKTWIVLVAAALVIVGCKAYPRRTIKPTAPPPLPPGFKVEKLDSKQLRSSVVSLPGSVALLLKHKLGVRLADVEAFHRLNKASGKYLRHIGWSIARIPPGKGSAYSRSGLFERVDTNQVYKTCRIPNDPFWPLWGLQQIQADKAWDLATSNNVVVAVVDTGVDYSHPDIALNLWTGQYGEHGYTATGGTLTVGGADDFNHGTHVAGIIGATGNNGIGIMGVNWRTKIISFKFITSKDEGTTMDAVLCFDKMIELKKAGQNICVCNNSWGQDAFGVFDPAMRDAFEAAENAGILSVCASGNQQRNTDIYPFYPASYPLNGIISVNASESDDTRAGFSNFGLFSTDIMAPGGDIVSLNTNGGYESRNGTSMACAYVSGAATMLFGFNPNITVSQCKAVLLDPASTDPTTDTQSTTGGRRLNIAKAIRNPKLFSPVLHITRSGNSVVINWDSKAGDVLEESVNLKNWSSSFTYGPPPVSVHANQQLQFFRVKRL